MPFWNMISAFLFILVGLVVVGLVLVLIKFGAAGRSASIARIRINGARTVEVPTGGTLLAALSGQGVHLRTTCGGNGTCALCQCRVMKGGGTPLERERPYFDRAQLADHWRLACQVTVTRDMVVEVPLDVLRSNTVVE